MVIENPCALYTCIQGGIVRGDATKKELSIVFTGGDYADGGIHILNVLQAQDVKSSFFFTGDFYRNQSFAELIHGLVNNGHYLGAHSDKHLLYCDWENRDSLLVTKDEFLFDLKANYLEMKKFGLFENEAKLFMPPYEWYNDSISQWTNDAGFQLVNFTSGTCTNADYTTPEMSSYLSSEMIWKSVTDYEANSPTGLNGFIILIHIGTAPDRTDKFYYSLEELILWLKGEGYEIKRIDDLLSLE